MATAKIVVKIHGTSWVVQHESIELTETQLDVFLKKIPRKYNPRKVTAKEYMDYVDGRGELALTIELSGNYKEMHDLKNALANQIRIHMENDPNFHMVNEFHLLTFKAYRGTECGRITIT